MVEKVLQPTGREIDVTENDVAVTKRGDEEVRVESHVFVVHHGTTSTTSGVFTRNDFESILDKVSRSVKGKYRDALPSSEEFIKDKRQEVELEDRQP